MRRGCALAALFAAACSSSKPPEPAQAPVGVTTSAPTPRVDFAYDSLDDRPVTAEALRGKPAVLVFMQVGNVNSQGQIAYLVAMAKHDGDKVGYAMVALEPRSQRELLEMYRKWLGVEFPVALADAATMAGAGAFGDFHGLPVTVVLDRGGRVVYRVDGRVAKSDELREHMRGL